MQKIRLIPCLLLKGQGLVKTLRFSEPKYVGDPINAVRIFNEKEVDELIFLDITATVGKRKPNLKLIHQIAGECFMPFSYGGGIRSPDDVKKILNSGVEKVIINSYAVENPTFIKDISNLYGSQSIVVSIDVKKNMFGKYEVFTHAGSLGTKIDPVRHAVCMEEIGAGELFLNSIDRDGTMQGYDIELVKRVSEAVGIPVIACGGAGKLGDFVNVVNNAGASAVAAGSMFVFHGKHRAVLISYPSSECLQEALK